MILVDRRIGSKDLLAPLIKLGLDAELTELSFGDVAFEGKGQHNTSVDIGIELKCLPDLISSLRTGRLAGHQMPGLLKTYEYTWLVIEGTWRPDRKGEVALLRNRGWHSRTWQPLHGRMTVSEMEKQVLTLELCGGLHVRYTNNRRATLEFISTLFRWWTDKSMSKHQSHLAVHVPQGFSPISDFRQVVSRFPGIGLKTSLAVERHFHASLDRACTADVDEWAAIETKDDKGKPRRVGIKVAEGVVKFCRGETR